MNDTTSMTDMPDRATEPTPPHEPFARLFLRFLRFGLLAWGGPVAQIAMIRQELVEEEAWISREKFNRVLAVYQALPGPEAHELCVYFGTIARGRLGGLLAGLGFMLPGLALMLLLSWCYVAYGLGTAWLVWAFRGMQPAVVALLVRGIHRIGKHALADRWLTGIALLTALAEWRGVPFSGSLLLAGLSYLVVRRQHLVLALLGWGALFAANEWLVARPTEPLPVGVSEAMTASLGAIFLSGLRAGLLTFGGAYTAVPFLQHDAVERGRWLTNEQFLDSLALSGILPAPFIIFATFVGYVGGGLPGALLMTAGVFGPAFAFTLIGHEYLERLVHLRQLHDFLDGLTAGVVGLVSVSAISLGVSNVRDLPSLGIFVAALILLYVLRAKASIAVVMAGAALAGWATFG